MLVRGATHGRHPPPPPPHTHHHHRHHQTAAARCATHALSVNGLRNLCFCESHANTFFHTPGAASADRDTLAPLAPNRFEGTAFPPLPDGKFRAAASGIRGLINPDKTVVVVGFGEVRGLLGLPAFSCHHRGRLCL
jgi:hypothetical protein